MSESTIRGASRSQRAKKRERERERGKRSQRMKKPTKGEARESKRGRPCYVRRTDRQLQRGTQVTDSWLTLPVTCRCCCCCLCGCWWWWRALQHEQYNNSNNKNNSNSNSNSTNRGQATGKQLTDKQAPLEWSNNVTMISDHDWDDETTRQFLLAWAPTLTLAPRGSTEKEKDKEIESLSIEANNIGQQQQQIIHLRHRPVHYVCECVCVCDGTTIIIMATRSKEEHSQQQLAKREKHHV